jgi:autotransporter-associated beta strand protein
VGANWVGGSVAGGAGALADFSQVNYSADAGASSFNGTLGEIRFGDLVPSHNFTITGSQSNLLYLEGNADVASIRVANQQLTLAGRLVSGDSIEKWGAGTLVIGNDHTVGYRSALTGALVAREGLTVLGGGLAFGQNGLLQGSLQISSGATVRMAQAEVLDNRSLVTVEAGGTWDMNGLSEAIGNLSGAGAVTLGAGSLTFDLGANASFAGNISGSSGLTVAGRNGGGVQTLTGVSDFTGNVSIGNAGQAFRFNDINSGIFTTSNASRPAVSIARVENSGLAGPLGAGSSVALNHGAVIFSGTTDSTNRSWSVLGKGEISVTTASEMLSLTGVVTSAAGDLYATGLTKSGDGILSLEGAANNTDLGVIVAGGMLNLAKASTAAIHAVNMPGDGLWLRAGSTLTLGGTGNDQISSATNVRMEAGATFNLSGKPEGINGLRGAGTVTTTTAATLTMGQGNAAWSQFSGTLQNGTAALTLVKTGTGVQVLSGPMNETAGTTINGGVLAINGTVASAATTVGVAGTLSGIGRTRTVNLDGILDPGSTGLSPSTGTHTASRVNFRDGSIGSLGLGNTAAGPANDQLVLVNSGGLNTAGANTINIRNLGNMAPGTTTLMTYAGAIGGSGFAALSLGTLPPRVSATLTNGVGTIDLTVTAADAIRFYGNLGNNWSGANFRTVAGGVATSYIENLDARLSDTVIFDDINAVQNPIYVALPQVLHPSQLLFKNAQWDTNVSMFGIAGDGGVYKSGAKDAVFGFNTINTYTGGTHVSSGGLLYLSEPSQTATTRFGTGPIVLGDAATGAQAIRFGMQNGGNASLVPLANDISVPAGPTGSVTIGNLALTSFIPSQFNSFQYPAIFSGSMDLNRPVSLVADALGATLPAVFRGPIEGNVGTLTISGKVTLAGENSFTGNVVLQNSNAGTILKLVGSNHSQIPDGAGVTVNAGSVVLLMGESEKIGFLNGNGVVHGDDMDYGMAPATLTLNGGNFTGRLSNIYLHKTGPETLQFGGVQDGSPNQASLTVDEGMVEVVATGGSAFVDVLLLGGVLKNTSAQNDMLIGGKLILNGGTVDLNGRTEEVTSLTGSGGTITSSSGGRLAVRLPNTAPVENFHGHLTGAMGLDLMGPGRLSLDGRAGAADYTGTTVISNSSTLIANDGQAIGDQSVVSVYSQLIVNGSETIGALEGSGTVVVNSPGNVLTFGGAGGSHTFTGQIAGPGGLRKIGNGVQTLELFGLNYSGPTLIDAGTLVASGGSGLSDFSAVTISSGATLSVTGSEGTRSLHGSGHLELLTNGGLVVGANAAVSVFNGTISGPGNLTQVGTGSLTLTGTSTGTGQVYVAGAGSLLVMNGDHTASSALWTADVGSTLSGTGIIGGNLNLSGSLAPGNSAGTLTALGNLVTSGSSPRLVMELNSPTLHDQIVVGGSLQFGSTTVLQLTLNYAPNTGDEFILINKTSPGFASGLLRDTNLALIPEGGTVTASGYPFSLTYRGGNGNDVVLTSLIPEPSTAFMLAGALLIGLSSRQRRK